MQFFAILSAYIILLAHQALAQRPGLGVDFVVAPEISEHESGCPRGTAIHCTQDDLYHDACKGDIRPGARCVSVTKPNAGRLYIDLYTEVDQQGDVNVRVDASDLEGVELSRDDAPWRSYRAYYFPA